MESLTSVILIVMIVLTARYVSYTWSRILVITITHHEKKIYPSFKDALECHSNRLTGTANFFEVSSYQEKAVYFLIQLFTIYF